MASENIAVSSRGAICALGLPSRSASYARRPLTCGDTTRLGQGDGVRGPFRLR